MGCGCTYHNYYSRPYEALTRDLTRGLTRDLTTVRPVQLVVVIALSTRL